MKKLLPVLSLFLFFLFALLPKAKCQVAKDTANYPYWIEMMQYDTVNFFRVQRAFYRYYAAHHDADEVNKEENGEEEEDEDFALFKRWEYITSRRIKPDGTRLKPAEVFESYQKFLSSITSGGIKGSATAPGSNPSGNWKSIGPFSIPADRVYQPDGIGRINAIAFHPTKKGTIYVGAPDGGLWVTADSGATWATNTDGLASLGVSAIAIDPGTPATIYIGTGDRDNNDASGLGILKSTNSGSTWSASNTGMGNVVVSKILIDPQKTSVLLAATSGGIYRSTSSGSSWSKTSSSSGFYKDIVFKPHNPNVVYATAGSLFFRSTNNGATWTQITTGLTSSYRGVIAVTPADTNRVYFLVTGSVTFSAFYISTNGGTSFRTKSTTPNIMDYSDNGSGTGGQAFYDLCIAADTVKAGTIYVGGINVFKSTDSGATWSVVAHWVGTGAPDIHADIHVLAINPLNNELFACDDGGVAYTTNGGTSWKDMSNGLAITEIYKLGQSQSRSDMMLIGCQDNGTAQFAKNKWYSVLGGDGMVCAIDPNDTNYQYAEIYYGSIYRSTDAGQSFSANIAGKGIGNITEQGAWVTPYMLSYANSKEMFAGYDNLWKCSNLKAAAPTWAQLSSGLASTNSALIQAIDQSPMDTNTFYMSRDDNTFFISKNVNASTPAWTDLTSKLPNSGSLVTAIRTHPKYANVVYIIQDNDIYVSTNYGSSWTKISGTLPNVPKNVIAIDKNSYTGLYLGTDAGVYYMDSTMADWTPFYSGLPVEPRIMDLAIYYDSVNSANNFINAGSYGRGAWQSGLFTPVIPVAAFGLNGASQCLTNNSFVFSDSSTISSGLLSSWAWDFGDTKTSTKQNPTHTYASGGTYTVKLVVSSSLGTTSNISKTITVLPQAVPAFIINTVSQCLSANSYSFTDKSTSSSGTLKWSWNFGDGTGGSISENPTYAYKTAGTDTVKLTVTINNACPATTSKTVTVYPGPTISFKINNAAQCLTGNSFGFTNKSSISSGSISSWKWKFGDGDSSASQNPTYLYSGAGTYKVILMATSALGCADTGSQMVIVYPQAKPGFGINSAAQCLAGNDFVFTDKSTSSTGALKWNWSFGDGTGSSTSQDPTYSYKSAGIDTVKLTVSVNNACPSFTSQTITVYPGPAVSFKINSAAQCLTGNSFGFTNKSSISSGSISSWNWKFGNGDSSVSQSPTYTYSKAGAYKVILTATSASGCSDTGSQTMTVFPQAKPAFIINSAGQCFSGNKFLFTDKSTISSGNIITWLWDMGDTHDTAIKNPIYSYATAGTYKVKVFLTSNNLCLDTISKLVVVYPQPKSAFAINNVFECLKNNSYLFTDKSTAGNGNKIMGWNWNFGDSIFSSSQNPVHSFIYPGNHIVSLVVSDSNKCTDSTSKTVTVYPKIKAAFNTNDSVQCFETNSFSFADQSTLPSTGTNNWAWNFGDNQKSSSQSPAHVYGNPGNYKVILVVSNSDGCKDTVNKTVIVHPKILPVLSLNSLTQCFNGNNFSFIDSSSTSSGSIASRAWNFGDGSISTAQGQNHTYSNAGSYSVTLTVKSDQGCFDSLKQTVNVKSSPSPVISGGAVICAGSNNSYLVAKDSASSFNWTVSGGNILSTLDTTDSISVNWPAPVSGTVRIVQTNSFGCTDSDSLLVNVKPLPTAKFGAANNNTVCAGSVLNFVDSSKSASGYIWIFGDGDTTNAATALHTYTSAGKYVVKQIVTNTMGCSDTTQRIVMVNPLPVSHWSADSVQNAYIIFIAKDTVMPSAAYAWDFGDGTKATGHKLRHIFPGNKTYSVKLTVTGTNGCTNEFDSTINVTVSGIAPGKDLNKSLTLNIYPNPFHNSTNIEYALSANSDVKIVLYDIEGKEISIIANQNQATGNYKYEIDAAQYGLNPGTYLVKIYVNGTFVTRNVVKL